jgi:hypothetical protein
MNATILRPPEEHLRVLQDFRNKSDADKAQAIDGHLAIITGLIGLDAVHGDLHDVEVDRKNGVGAMAIVTHAP